MNAELNSGKMETLTSKMTPVATRMGYAICVAKRPVTCIAGEVNKTTETIISNKTKRNSLGVCDLKKPCNRRAMARNKPRIAYAADGFECNISELKYIPNSDHARPATIPPTVNIRDSAITPKRRPGCPKTVVMGAR